MMSDVVSNTHVSSIDGKESHSKTNSHKRHKSRKNKNTEEDDSIQGVSGREFDPKKIKLPAFKSIYDKKTLETFPQRTRWQIPDSKVIFSSEFCSGNLARA